MSNQRSAVRRWMRGVSGGAPTVQYERSNDVSYADGFVIAVCMTNKQQSIMYARRFDAMCIELGVEA